AQAGARSSVAEQRTHNPSVGGSIPPGPTPPAPPLPVPPGHLDRLVPVLLLAALLRCASTIWAVSEFRFPHVDAGDRAGLFARNLGMTPGLLVLLAGGHCDRLNVRAPRHHADCRRHQRRPPRRRPCRP